MAKTSKPSSAERDLDRFKNSARGARVPRAGVSAARPFLPESLFVPAVQWLETAYPKGARVMGSSFPSTVQDLHRHSPLKPLKPRSEFLWAATRISLHSERLNSFVHLQNEISALALHSRFGEALAALDSSEATLGVSLWAIKLRMALLQKHEGFEAHKRYALSIMDPRVDEVVQYVTHYVSIRNESAVSPASFKSLFERHKAAQVLPEQFDLYLTFHILPHLPVTEAQAASILSTEDAGALIDLYETFVRLAAQLYSTDQDGFKQFALPAVSLLRNTIHDLRLAALEAAALGNWSAAGLPSIDQAPLEHFLIGQFEAALERSLAHLRSGGNDWESIELLARSAAVLGRDLSEDRGPLWLQLASHMQHLLVKTTQAGEGTTELFRIGINMDGLNWTDRLFGFVEQEQDGHVFFQSTHLSSGSYLPPLSLCPVYSLGLAQHGSQFLDASRLAYGDTLTLTYVQQFLNGEALACLAPSTSPVIARLATSERALLHDAEHSLELSPALTTSPQAYFAIRAIRIYIAALLTLNRISAYIQYVTDVYLDNPDLHPILSISALTSLVGARLRRELRADPSVAILFDMYGRHVNEDLTRKLRIIYQQFLAAHVVVRPSQLRASVVGDRRKVVYFLRYVCVPKIMSGSVAFHGSEEVEAERLAVCQLLAELDIDNVQEYQTEIKEITTQQAVRRGMQQVAQSKIFVDVDGVSRAAEKNLREAFNRYRALAASGVEELVQGVMDALRKARSGDSGGILALQLPKSGARDILELLVSDLRDEFVSNTQYGLDGYLSQRIRHGTLQGHLRSPLEAAHLITQQEAGSSKYKPNVFWSERLMTTNEKIRSRVAERLAQFSSEMDGLITKVRTEWIQVRRSDAEKGMFDFRVGPAVLPILTSALATDPSFRMFVDTGLGVLWKQLEDNLARVRQRIQTELKDSVNTILDHLRRDLEDITGGIAHSDLGGAVVGAQTGLQRALDRMAEWFCVPTQTSDHPFRLSLAVHVAAETTCRFHQNFALQHTCKTTTDPAYPLAAWVSFVDVFLILMENAVKHCGLPGGTRVQVEISESNGLIHIKVSNRVAEGVKNVEAIARIRKIKEDIERGDYKYFVPREGRSGFYKIRKIVGQDFQALEQIDFRFADDLTFVVDIVMNRGVIDASVDH